ncbi:MAG: gamma-glutamyl-gamma-aminobutyrate hydrolase family protein, partial [Thermofilaceae archaeon]
YGGKKVVKERFRHRYHIIQDYAIKGRDAGLIVSATDASGRIINAIELESKSWIVGVQFHPEFKSRVTRPSPIYLAFIRAAYESKKKHETR